MCDKGKKIIDSSKKMCKNSNQEDLFVTKDLNERKLCFIVKVQEQQLHCVKCGWVIKSRIFSKLFAKKGCLSLEYNISIQK